MTGLGHPDITTNVEKDVKLTPSIDSSKIYVHI